MGPVHSEIIIIMKAFIFASLLAVAAAVPIEDTPEVAAAKAEFAAAFAAAEAGEHAALAPVQGATAYLADLPEVAEAKAAHAAVFDAYTAGTVALPVAPVFTGVQPAHVVEPVVATPAVAPVAIAAYPYAHHYGAYGAYPAYAHAAYAGAYAGYPYAGAYGHPAYAFGGYPYALPVAAAKAE